MRTLPKWRKRLLIVLSILLVLLLLGSAAAFAVDAHMRGKVQDRMLSAQEAALLEDVDCILVLGCGLSDDKPGPMLTDRLNQGIALYELRASDKLLMSGDHGQAHYDEVNAMKQFAMDANIPSEDVFMDHAGFSTYESMYRARDIFCAEKLIIVTQDYHLYRALYVAESLGLEAYGVAADSPRYSGQGYRDFREFLARNKDFLYTLFTPKPALLGEAIPVSGNGDLTNDDPW